jgi:hypothetical protein
MAVPVIAIKVAAFFSKTPVVTTIVVGKVTVTAPELSSAAAFGEITTTHMRPIIHAMWSISAHGMGSTTTAHRVRSTAHGMGSTTTAHRVRSTAHGMRSTTAAASHASATTASATEVCATASSASTPSATPASATVGYEG